MHRLAEHELSGTQTSGSALHQFAQGLENNLKQLFRDSPSLFNLLEEVFDITYHSGGREHSTIPRRDDEWFNPRCARLPQLLISEINEDNLEILLMAILVTIRGNTLAPDGAQLPELAIRVREHLSYAYKQENSVTLLPSAVVYYADWIDQVRHLHLSTRTPKERIEIISQAKNFLRNHPLPLAKKRLATMLLHAISQQERRCIA